MESSLNDCNKILYPLNIAKQLADTTDEIAAVACIFETTTSTQASIMHSLSTTVKQSRSTKSSNVHNVQSNSVQSSNSIQPTLATQNKPNFLENPYATALSVLVGVVLLLLIIVYVNLLLILHMHQVLLLY